MPTAEELKKIFKEAADIAEHVPEALRQAAFQRALDALLGPDPDQPALIPQKSGQKTSQKASPVQAKSNNSSSSGAVTQLLEIMNRSELAELMAGKKTLDRALLILKAAQNHGINELSASDIAQILTQKFREATKSNAVRMALDRSPSYTDRRPSGGTYQYSIMAPGERYLESGAENSSSVKKARVRKIVKTTPSTKEPKGTKQKGSKPKAGKVGRPGPKAMVEVLLHEGFFAVPKTIGQILSHIEEKKTHRYATSDFTATLQRMVRQLKLDRFRNSDGQYEYKAR